MFDRWNFTVCSVTHSIRASSAFEWPSATSCRISSSLRVSPGESSIGTGAGVTWGSDPGLEWAETELKAARLLAVAAGGRS